jgi:hypothetical protein
MTQIEGLQMPLSVCLQVPMHHTFDGGGGALLSVGLLKALGYDLVLRECIESGYFDRFGRQGGPCVTLVGGVMDHNGKK